MCFESTRKIQESSSCSPSYHQQQSGGSCFSTDRVHNTRPITAVAEAEHGRELPRRVLERLESCKSSWHSSRRLSVWGASLKATPATSPMLKMIASPHQRYKRYKRAAQSPFLTVPPTKVQSDESSTGSFSFSSSIALLNSS